MSSVIRFKPRSQNLEECIEVMDVVYDKLSSLQEELSRLQDAADNLQDAYDDELNALAHRLGGIENCPVDYLMYTTLDTEIIKTIEEKLCKEIG